MNQDVGFLAHNELQSLLDVLQGAGYRCIGPMVRDGAIVFDELSSVTALPQGIRDRQRPGEYRLTETDSPRYFAWANGPQALKPLVFAPQESLWSCERDAQGTMRFTITQPDHRPTAVLGVRACDLAALYIHDQHFLQQAYPDPYYLARRQQMLLVAVNCTHPADTCFCASTGDGPQARYGYDLVLTEQDDGFVLEAHSDLGKQQMQALPLQPVTQHQLQQVEADMQQSARVQQRRLPSRNLNQALFANLHHPRWAEVAERCLSCGNCTSVCPTCFCHTSTETPAISGELSIHQREWDSCFTPGHSYIHGLTLRADTAKRYRQWLTHKLGSWHDQYGRSGCVGCGRCVTWCPVGIDITEEAAAICGQPAEQGAST
ncbi:MAG: 4Fe-4S dicluster domain-containing protein [Gammaproteobacteria bacterium]|nr:4Fe-4S dicluster domain-containing protein [Gammaproteobacteria bacterium]